MITLIFFKKVYLLSHSSSIDHCYTKNAILFKIQYMQFGLTIKLQQTDFSNQCTNQVEMVQIGPNSQKLVPSGYFRKYRVLWHPIISRIEILEILGDEIIRQYHGKGNLSSETNSFEKTINKGRYKNNICRRTIFELFGILLSLLAHD